jgi:hypothetical protein
MQVFTISWEVDFWEPEDALFLITEEIEAQDLDSLFDILDEGIDEGLFCPEEKIPNNFELGSVNIEYVKIANAKGEVLYTDEDFDPQRNHQII